MNDDLMIEYLIEMGAMRPEQDELKRKQGLVDALRKGAMTPLEGQMVGKHYVPPNIAQAIAQMGQAYIASKQQGGVDDATRNMNVMQRGMLENLRKRRRNYGGDPMSQWMYGTGTGGD